MANDMGHVQPPLQNVQSSRDIADNFVRRGRGRGGGLDIDKRLGVKEVMKWADR